MSNIFKINKHNVVRIIEKKDCVLVLEKMSNNQIKTYVCELKKIKYEDDFLIVELKKGKREYYGC